MRSQLVAPALSYARAAGVDPRGVMERLGLPASAESDAEVILPLEDLRALFAWLEEATGDPCVGAHLGLALGRGTYGIVEYICRAAPTIEAALTTIARYAPLLDELVVIETHARDGLFYFTQSIPGEPEVLGRHANELYVTMLVTLGRAWASGPACAERVWVAHARPPSAPSIAPILGVDEVEYGATTNGFAARLDVVQMPMRDADPVLYEILVAKAEELAALRGAHGRFVGHVRQTVRAALRERLPTIDATARSLRLTPRALQRRLAAERTSFQEIVESVREEVARQMLRDGTSTVAEIADH